MRGDGSGSPSPAFHSHVGVGGGTAYEVSKASVPGSVCPNAGTRWSDGLPKCLLLVARPCPHHVLEDGT